MHREINQQKDSVKSVNEAVNLNSDRVCVCVCVTGSAWLPDWLTDGRSDGLVGCGGEAPKPEPQPNTRSLLGRTELWNYTSQHRSTAAPQRTEPRFTFFPRETLRW